MKLLHTHGLPLTIDGFNPFPIATQVILISPGVGCHVATANRYKAHAGLGENRGGIGVRDVAFVAKDGSPLGQADSQTVDGRQILLSGRQQVKADRHTVRRTNQVQAPAEELLLFRRTLATKCLPAHLLAARGPRPLAHR